MKRFFLVMCLATLMPSSAYAFCEKMWDTAKLARAGPTRTALAAIPTSWFQGINIVHEKIDKQSGIKTTLYLCEDHRPNAFAFDFLGQRFTALTTGMYLMFGNDWHAYAAVIGHENAHIVKQHGMSRLMLDTAMRVAANGAVSIPGASLALGAIGSSYSQSEELEADKYGMQYAYCAGFAPEAALHFHEKVKSGFHFMSSHPTSDARIRLLRKAIAKQKRWAKCK